MSKFELMRLIFGYSHEFFCQMDYEYIGLDGMFRKAEGTMCGGFVHLTVAECIVRLIDDFDEVYMSQTKGHVTEACFIKGHYRIYIETTPYGTHASLSGYTERKYVPGNEEMRIK